MKETRHTRRNNNEEKGESREKGKVVGERGLRENPASSGRLFSRNSRLNGHSQGYVWLRGWLTVRLDGRLVVLLVRRFWHLFSLRLLSLLTLGFTTPADHDLAERSAKQYQDDSRTPCRPLSTSLSSLSPTYTVTLACIQPANEATNAHLPKKEGHGGSSSMPPIHLTPLGA